MKNHSEVHLCQMESCT